MDDRIEQALGETRANIDKTMKELCGNRVKKPEITTAGGVYAFWNGGKAVYIGRARNILRRYKQHLEINKNKSPLARKIAKEFLAKETGGEEGKKYLIAHYGSTDDENNIRKKIEERLKGNDIKERMEAMEFSFCEQENTLQQYLSEMFCSIGLGTVVLDEKGDEEDSIEKVEGENYYHYCFYNSFRTS